MLKRGIGDLRLADTAFEKYSCYGNSLLSQMGIYLLIYQEFFPYPAENDRITKR